MRERERERGGGTGKMRSYSEEKIYIIVSSIDNDPVVYKIRPEHDPKSKTRTVHPNMLRHCDNLLDNFDWNIREPVYQKHPVSLEKLVKRFKINLNSPNQLQVIQTRRISISALTSWDFQKRWDTN